MLKGYRYVQEPQHHTLSFPNTDIRAQEKTSQDITTRNWPWLFLYHKIQTARFVCAFL